MAYKIMLDAGHGGVYDPGAVYNGRQEKDDTLALVLQVGQILSDYGFDVEYTRTEDVYETPYRKAQKGNESGADVFVSIHRNSSPYPNTYSGVETLVYNRFGLAARLADNINTQLEEVGYRNLGINERPNLVVLRDTEMPSVLVEVGFINTDRDNQLLDENFYATAKAIADGVAGTLWSLG